MTFFDVIHDDIYVSRWFALMAVRHKLLYIVMHDDGFPSKIRHNNFDP
jgi:hypothetical protein